MDFHLQRNQGQSRENVATETWQKETFYADFGIMADSFIFKEQRYNFWQKGGKRRCVRRAFAAITCLSGQREPGFDETAIPLKLKGISADPSGGPSCVCRALTATI